MRRSYRLSLVGRARQPLKGLGTAGANKTADRPGSGVCWVFGFAAGLLYRDCRLANISTAG